MILVNTSPNSINADFHFVPTVHLQDTDRAAVKAYAAMAGATATINQATIIYNAPAPFTASFSSRGPLRAGGGDLLKPDVIAPGQDILAAVAPPANAGRDFDVYSGTSMSTPHVAGLAALLMDLHPDWSPMAVKSALMTSAYDVLDGPNTNPLVIFLRAPGTCDPALPILVWCTMPVSSIGWLSCAAPPLASALRPAPAW
jgi:subtilisin family serine protease